MVAHAVTPAIFYSGTWHDISADVLEGEQIKITRGLPEDGSLRPSKIEWTFNNATDAYRPTNPTSPLYGLAGRGMPCRAAVGGSVRAVGEATSYRPDQTPDFAVGPPRRGMRWVDLTAEGQLARIAGWDEPLRSAIYQKLISNPELRGYWPLEDGRSATQLTNAVSGGQPGYLIGAVPAADDGPGGGGTATQSTASSRMGGSFLTMSTSAGWQVQFTIKLDAPAAGGTHRPLMQWTTANGYTWSWEINFDTFRIKVTESDGTVLEDSSVGYGTGVDPTGWTTYRIVATVAGSTVNVTPYWYPQDASVLWFYNPSFTGTLSRPTTWRQNGNVTTDGALYGHMLAVSGIVEDLGYSDVLAAYNGFIGERAGDRFTRLCSELGIASTFVGTSSATWPMGRQKPDTAIATLKEIRDTEDGLIFDTAGSLGLTMRARATLYNQVPKLTLTYPGDIAPPLTEAIDTLNIANQVTVSQRDGGSAVATLTTGLLSTQAPPAGIGTIKGSVDVNVAAESALPGLAGWHLAKGTIDAPRYSSVVIDLDQSPGLAAAAATVGEGDLIVINGRAPEPINLIVLGIAEQIRTHRRKITFTCVPADVYAMGVYSAATSRYDVDGSTTAEAMTTSETIWDISGAGPDDVWSTTAVPYEWIVGGERVRVTAMGAATGTGPYLQQCTVVRSVNGVVKEHGIGAQIHMADRTAVAGRVRYAI